MTERLNPKLTQRSSVSSHWDREFEQLSGKGGGTSPSLDVQSSLSLSEDAAQFEDTSATSRTNTTNNTDTESFAPRTPFRSTNPNRHLLHCGKWLPKAFEVGRPVRRTGLWTCCGGAVHFSLYCPSLEAREVFRARILGEIRAEMEEELGTRERRQRLQEELALLSESVVDASEVPVKPSAEEKALRAAQDAQGGSLQAPQLLSWLLRHLKEEVTLKEGLLFLLHHIESAQGCVLMQRNGAADVLLRIFERHGGDSEMMLLLLRAFWQLLRCNLTRMAILKEFSRPVVEMAIALAHRHMNSGGHVEAGVGVLEQCLRIDHNSIPNDNNDDDGHLYEQTARLFWSLNIPVLLLLISRRYVRTSPSTLRMVVTICLWLASDLIAIRALAKLKIVTFIHKCMQTHPKEGSLLVPCVNLLSRLGLHHAPALEHILKLNLSANIVKALQLCYDDQELTLAGLKLLRCVAKTSEGFTQLNNIKNAWQAISQGTSIGDALVHRLPGAFQNPGWALGDTPYLPAMERAKLLAKTHFTNSLSNAPTRDWTVSSLRQYMGLSMDGKKLAINQEYHLLFFELVVTLDLLPKSREEKEDWFKRLRVFEKENDLSLDEMIATIREMRARDALNRQMQKDFLRSVGEGGNAIGEEFLGNVKPLFVNGEQITTKTLEERDLDINEALQF